MKNIFVMKINAIHYRRPMFKSLVLHEPQNTIKTLAKKNLIKASFSNKKYTALI